MRDLARQLAASVCVATLLCLSGCGDGDAEEKLEFDLDAGRQALGAAGVVRLTISTLIALRTEDSAVMSVGSTCTSGDLDSSCRVEDRMSVLRGSFDDCRVPLSNGEALTADGDLRIETGDVGVCVTGRIPESAAVDFHYDSFEQVLSDANGNELVRSRIDGTDEIVPTALSCAGSDLVETLNATIDQTVNHRAPARLAADGLDVRVRARGLQLTQTATGAPCERSIVAGGEMEIDDRVSDSEFSQSIHGITLEYTEEEDDAVVRLHGNMTSECVGDIAIETIEPLRIHSASECPMGGVLRVTVNGRTNTTTFGAQGQITIEADDRGFGVVGSECPDPPPCG